MAYQAREDAIQRAAAAAKQLQEERERLGISRYREDRPDDAQTLADRARDQLLKQGRYSEYLASIKAELQAIRLAERGGGEDGDAEEEDGSGDSEPEYTIAGQVAEMSEELANMRSELSRLSGVVLRLQRKSGL